MEEEVLEQEVVEQEPVAEEPQVEQEVDAEVEQSSEQPAEQPVVEPETPTVKSRVISTNGLWKTLESVLGQELEMGKTYNIKLGGTCEIMISETQPTVGIKTNEITYKKQPGMNLWIKTGE